MEYIWPIILNFGNMMDEEEFFRFCQINEMVDFERDSEGNVLVLPLSGARGGIIGAHLTWALSSWNIDSQLGVGFGCSAGFTLPNKAVRSPDASWMTAEKWNQLSRDEKERFAPVCPDFVVELRHNGHDLQFLLNKMREYIDNGVQLGGLIDRFDKKAFIFRADGSVEIVGINAVLSGEKVLPGFSLDLRKLLKA